MRLRALFHQLIDGELAVPRHGADFTPHAFTGTGEQREDEIGRFELSLANEIAQGLGGAQPAHSVYRKCHLPKRLTEIPTASGASPARCRRARTSAAWWWCASHPPSPLSLLLVPRCGSRIGDPRG